MARSAAGSVNRFHETMIRVMEAIITPPRREGNAPQVPAEKNIAIRIAMDREHGLEPDGGTYGIWTDAMIPDIMVEGGQISTMEEEMALNIKDAETHRLARELADLTQTSISKAVKEALLSALERKRYKRVRNNDILVADLDAIALHCAALPVLDSRTAEEIVGYDDRGVPV